MPDNKHDEMTFRERFVANLGARVFLIVLAVQCGLIAERLFWGNACG